MRISLTNVCLVLNKNGTEGHVVISPELSVLSVWSSWSCVCSSQRKHEKHAGWQNKTAPRRKWVCECVCMVVCEGQVCTGCIPTSYVLCSWDTLQIYRDADQNKVGGSESATVMALTCKEWWIIFYGTDLELMWNVSENVPWNVLLKQTGVWFQTVGSRLGVCACIPSTVHLIKTTFLLSLEAILSQISSYLWPIGMNETRYEVKWLALLWQQYQALRTSFLCVCDCSKLK